MSGLIEKITLYDLLGYALPGSILLGMISFTAMMIQGNMKSLYDMYKDAVGYFFIVLLILGYVAGMLMAEITDRIKNLFSESLRADMSQYLRDHRVNYSQVGQALMNAGYVEKKEEIQSAEDVLKYLSGMYGDIQSDAKYNRLHNYASAKLICKNMAFVSISGILLSVIYLLFTWDFSKEMLYNLVQALVPAVVMIVVFLYAADLFKSRWEKMFQKTNFYTVIWFAEKYQGKVEKE